MIEIQDDIWNYLGLGHIVITTNGFVKSNGEAVMGRGIARQAVLRYPDLPVLLGERLSTNGNHLYQFLVGDVSLLTFPVKERWDHPALEWLIQRSCMELQNFMDDSTDKVFIPHAGCYNGRLDWLTQVKPIYYQEFYEDDRIIIVDKA